MSTENDDRPVSPTYMGFQRWTKVSVEDFPLIRPPRRHMLSHVTGGLTDLYSLISEDKKRREDKSANENQINNVDKIEDQNQTNSESSQTREPPSSPKNNKIEEKNGEIKELEDPEEEKSKTKKKDDEGGGQQYNDGEEQDDEEETSPYTDEEGEFAPEEGIPLLASRYKYVEVLARGQSALIVKALDTFAKDKPVAIKVLHRIYKPIGSQEADILLELHRADPWLHVPFARLQNQFIYGPHYCLVFEFLSPTPLYNHYDQRNIRGPTSLSHVRNLCVKLLTVLGFLHKQNVIHADLKPENILLINEEDTSSVMVIDFGNALRNTEEELSLYYTDFELQTLLYRAPEVIFGLKFSLEIDMWSLGCLLAECYTGEPLFIGKTKEDILAKITKLLGPFPKEFGEGECADLFSEFIGVPLSRFERVENLRKRLNNCQDINFLLLLEKLLTFLPERRISPFEAACHPFVASVNPFLYLSSSQEHKRYPTVVLDMTTYPYLPGLPDDDAQDKIFVDGRKRLARYSHTKSSINSISNDVKETIEESVPEITQIVNHESKKDTVPNSVVEESPPIAQPTSSSSLPSSPQPLQNAPLSIVSPSSPVPIASAGSSSPVTCLEQPQSSKSESVKSPSIKSPQSDSSQTSTQTKQAEKKNKEETDPKGNNLDPKGDFSRTDVKQTLKSMGLRCEDFTISVYSREQAHAILRKQGVEVTNHVPPKQPQQPLPQPQPQPTPPPPPPTPTPSHPTPKQTQRQNKAVSNSNVRPSVSVLRPDLVRPKASKGHPHPHPHPAPAPTPAPPTPAPAPKQVTKVNDDDDDDDCVILDPPDGPKPPPPPPRRYPQQFQLMGTTVQVNRGAKRQMRSMSHAPMPKRQFSASSRSYFYNEGYQYEENQEASVQDTLKRLKNYNISITCRRNSSQRQPRVHTMDSDSDMDHDGSHLDSEDEEDMAKYLECEIDEEKDISMEAEDTLELDSSGSVNDITSETESPVKNRGREKRRNKIGTKNVDDDKLNSTVEVDDEEKEREEINLEKDSDNKSENAETDDKEKDNKEKDNKESDDKEKDKESDEKEKDKENDKEKVIECDDKEKDKESDEKEKDKESDEKEKDKESDDKEKDKDDLEKDKENDDKIKNDEIEKIGSPEKINDLNTLDEKGDVQGKEDALTIAEEKEPPSVSQNESMDSKPKESVPNLDELLSKPDESIPAEETVEQVPNKTESEPSEQTMDTSESEIINSSDVVEKESVDVPEVKETEPENDKKVTEDSTTKDVCDNLDDDINEELEKQLLEAGNLEDDEYEGEDMESECLDNYDLENEL